MFLSSNNWQSMLLVDAVFSDVFPPSQQFDNVLRNLLSDQIPATNDWVLCCMQLLFYRAVFEISLSLSLSLSLPDLFLKWKYNYYAVDICSNNIFVSCLVKNILYFRPVRLISDLFFLLWWSEENYHKMQFWNRNVFYCSDALSILTTHNALFAYFGLVAMCVVCDQNILCLFYNTKSHLYILVSLLQASGHTHNISFLYNTFALCLLVPQRLF